jgi:hypothetical protein
MSGKLQKTTRKPSFLFCIISFFPFSSSNERKAPQDHAQALFSFVNTPMNVPPPFFSPATSGKLYKTTHKPFFFPRVEPMGTRGVGRGEGERGVVGN